MTALWLALLLTACSGTDDSDDNTDQTAGDDIPASWQVTMKNIAEPDLIETEAGEKFDVMLPPALLIWHTEEFQLISAGDVASTQLEALAEDGNPRPLLQYLAVDVPGVEVIDVLAAGGVSPDGNYDESAMLPGQQASVTRTPLTATHMTLIFMFAWSNDVVVSGVFPIDATSAPADAGPTTALAMYDAGTEVNQEPGAGADQAPLQTAPNTGADEGGVITEFAGDDGFGHVYPLVQDFARVEITEAF